MSVGSGYTDPTSPGSEAVSTDNPALQTIPFCTNDGLVCLWGPDYLYDGQTHKGTIADIQEDDAQNDLRIVPRGFSWTSGGSYDGLWMIVRNSTNGDVWYKIDSVDTTNNYIYIYGEKISTFLGEVEDAIEIGRINAWRDFPYFRGEMASIKPTSVWIDHDGAAGADTASARSALYCQTFAQGITPTEPLTYVGEAQTDESTRSSKPKWRLGYDASPNANPRTTRGMIRVKAEVRNAQIKIRRIIVEGKAWGRG